MINVRTVKWVFLWMIFLSQQVLAQCTDGSGSVDLGTVTVVGYQQVTVYIDNTYSNYFSSVPVMGSGPGGVYSASPNTHASCSTQTLSEALLQGQNSTASQPNNSALPIPIRNANPIDIVNGSPVATQFGGVNGISGFVVFPNLGSGTGAALKSVTNLAQQNYTISALVNQWAPPSVNPNAMNNFLVTLGISQSTAISTFLSQLTTTQILQILAAFTWQEGFKPPGC